MNTTAQPIEKAKLDLLAANADAKKFKDILGEFDAKQLKAIQEFFWDFIIKESKTTPTKFTPKHIIEALEPTSKYQQRARCREPLGYCTISMCVRINPECAVKRITGIMLALRPFIETIVTARPEILSGNYLQEQASLPALLPPKSTPAVKEEPLPSSARIIKEAGNNAASTAPAASAPAALPESSASDAKEDPHGQTAAAQIKEKFEKYRPKLWEMVEFDGLDHAFIMTKAGHVVQTASSSRSEFEKMAKILSEEIASVIEQGDAASFHPLLTVTKEFKKGVLAIRSLGNDIYLVGTSETVLPGKIHSLIVRLGELLKIEMSIAEKTQAKPQA
ncbi:hypothetical protein Ctha_1840 [Chloroherpeton thalassium ATCC 35110]|uniref:Roadblock/LC7 family protein n=1 Tax=Chloroherpeton thalassium (strain ATCC 35110 / GB-78) TaxID=517418 RepID=B3QTU9_CHLT3|nr:hypothetical protein [Chloroherpeton thalassium]ACF14297.1 hypothetical protein Ctha_1840 [Chloroherpeton thalassium ATCC 35110]